MLFSQYILSVESKKKPNNNYLLLGFFDNEY